MSQPVAIVTGASRGIGAAIARRLSGMGYRLALVARSTGPLDELAASLPEARSFPADITQESDVQAAIQAIVDIYGRIDVLVNNAGAGVVRNLEDLTAADYHAVMGPNVLGAFLVTRAVAPVMIAAGQGHIVNMLSIAAKRTFPQWSLYCASKFALAGFSQAIAQELRPLGIQVTDLLPGAVDSDFWNDLGLDFPREAMLQPDDVAGMVAYALSQSKRARVAELVLEPGGGDL